MTGKLIFNYGCMNSGKSLQLLATAHNFQDRDISFVILKSAIDTRDEGVIHSRALGDRECVVIYNDTNIYQLISKTICFQELKWVLVDEAQFLTEQQVDELAAIADNLGINIKCYGLKTDFQTKLFPGSKRLIELADSVEEIKSSCSCGHKTMVNARIDENGNIVTEGSQVEVGAEERYIALCRKCYFEKIKKRYYINNFEKE